MNKTSNAIVALAGVSLAIGIGSSINATSKNPLSVRATTDLETITLANTSFSQVSGGNYVSYCGGYGVKSKGSITIKNTNIAALDTLYATYTITKFDSFTVSVNNLVNGDVGSGNVTVTLLDTNGNAINSDTYVPTGKGSNANAMKVDSVSFSNVTTQIKGVQLYFNNASSASGWAIGDVTLDGSYTVDTKVLESIDVTNPTTSFTQGDAFTFGGTVTATYDNGSTANVTDKATFSGYNLSSSGEQTVTVSYTEGQITKTTSYDIDVAAATLCSVGGTIDNGSLSSASSVREGSELSVTIEAEDNYARPATLEVTMGGSDLVAGEDYLYDPDDGTFYIASVTGDVVVNGECTKIHGAWQDVPYTVAEARAAIDSGVGVTNVYAVGYVSEIVTAYSAQYSNISFNIVDTLGDSTFLQAYRAVGDDADSIKVGGRVIVYGTLTKYSSTYEFAQGGQIVSWTNPELQSISVSGYTDSFETGDAFDFGGTVTATYVGGGEEDVTNKATFAGYNMSSASVQTVTVTYTENEITKTAQYDITVTVPVTKYAVTFVAGAGATGTMDPENIAENTEYELPDCGFTAPEGKQFDCWSVVIGGAEAAEKQPGDSITITAATTVTAVWETIPTVTYRKVTTNLDDFSGDYLVVYETESVAFDGSLTTLDVASNTVSVDVSSNAASALEMHEFHIASKDGGYSIQSASGKYIGKTANSNGLDISDSDKYTNTVAYSENNLVITSEGNCTLRYNSDSGQKRFRFYKSGQKAISLYLQVTEIDEFIETLKMTEYTDDFDYDKDRCDTNYGAAKAAFNALAPAQRAYFIAEGGKNGLYEDEYERLINWASAHYETIGTDDNSGDKNVLKKAVSIPAFAPSVSESDPLPIAIVVTFASMATLGGFVALKRRKSAQ